ncbi:MAG TPA: hypothetical protein VN918_01000, partial [Myxococcaceae bacterium]|nr:hypothetical protein [Myxococcaceae bacterium]
EKQLGLISRDQAIRTGMSERAIGRRLGAGRWRQVLQGEPRSIRTRSNAAGISLAQTPCAEL